MSQQGHQRARARASVVHLPGLERSPLARLLPSGRSLLVGFAIVLGAAGLYLLARSTPMFALGRIEVEGAPPAVAAHVRAALAPLEGRSLLSLDSAEVARRLAKLPDVAAAGYDRDFPHTLRVTVRPEQPVAVARRGPNAWLVAASTRTIAEVPLRTHAGLPRIWLAHSDDPQVGAAITDRFALRAVRALALARTAGFGGRVRMVRVRERDLTFLLGSGIELRLGDLHAVPLKLAVATRVLPVLLQHGGYLYLDVSVPERPVAGTSLNAQLQG
ncbi:MAG TPA: FtsQ-type POTRA domain-containing protein [Gaiellaceae bacterium]|nr:FtsQ-type POTRA domain-containing protein [Gaiellaceae bacterium]